MYELWNTCLQIIRLFWENKMNRFFIITNSEKDCELETTLYIQDYIQKKGGICEIQKESHTNLKGKYNYTDPAGIPADTQAILVLGGDGTLIQAARDVVDCDIPILGINLGTLGYLAEIDKNNIRQALDALFDETYEVEERMMLEGGSLQWDKEDWQVALNDVVISRKGNLRVVEYHIYVNDRYLTSYKADGIIIATPTGSTGYSMSAGGPIVAPNAQMMLITPICPHTLNRTSVVLDANDCIGISVGFRPGDNMEAKERHVEAVASFDAAHGIALCAGDRIEIQRSAKKMKLIKISKDSFLQVLSRKMGN